MQFWRVNTWLHELQTTSEVLERLFSIKNLPFQFHVCSSIWSHLYRLYSRLYIKLIKRYLWNENFTIILNMNPEPGKSMKRRSIWSITHVLSMVEYSSIWYVWVHMYLVWLSTHVLSITYHHHHHHRRHPGLCLHDHLQHNTQSQLTAMSRKNSLIVIMSRQNNESTTFILY